VSLKMGSRRVGRMEELGFEGSLSRAPELKSCMRHRERKGSTDKLDRKRRLRKEGRVIYLFCIRHVDILLGKRSNRQRFIGVLETPHRDATVVVYHSMTSQSAQLVKALQLEWWQMPRSLTANSKDEPIRLPSHSLDVGGPFGEEVLIVIRSSSSVKTKLLVQFRSDREERKERDKRCSRRMNKLKCLEGGLLRDVPNDTAA
jgi:hypothetical protein